MDKKYFLKKGKHRSGLHFKPVLFGGNTVAVSFKIDGWHYDKTNDQQREQWNKLFGYSELPHHHWNSSRIVFRWLAEKGTYEVAWYIYKHNKKYIIPINAFVPYKCGEFYTLYFTKPKFGYTLFPYHGGEATSPIDYNVEIKIR